jgi:hypothetical protein
MRPQSLRVHLTALVLAAALSALAGQADAGPPFLTDDPEPTDLGHWEIYNFANGTHTPGDTSGEAGLDLNYGGAKDLQLTAVFPLAYTTADGGSSGSGVVELAAKYKFIHQDGPVGLDIAVFPRVFLPTAFNQGPDRRANLLLPVWLGRDYGKWAWFGGGGLQINPGPGNRNFWVSGLAMTRNVSDRLMLGAEVFHQTADTVGGRDGTFLNAGGAYRFTKHWSLLFSAGPGVQNAREAGQYVFYTSLKADY